MYTTKNATYYSREEEKSEGILLYCTENYGILAKNEVNDCSIGVFLVRSAVTIGGTGISPSHRGNNRPDRKYKDLREVECL